MEIKIFFNKDLAIELNNVVNAFNSEFMPNDELYCIDNDVYYIKDDPNLGNLFIDNLFTNMGSINTRIPKKNLTLKQIADEIYETMHVGDNYRIAFEYFESDIDIDNKNIYLSDLVHDLVNSINSKLDSED